MRTKLDEIVEEESRKWMELMRPWPFGGDQVVVAERIAERAFRHGVEQCSQKLLNVGHGYLYGVQPAPAKFREWGYGSHYPEARRGERRKWLGAECNAGGVRLCVHSTDGALYFDRRSGKDRRKK